MVWAWWMLQRRGRPISFAAWVLNHGIYHRTSYSVSFFSLFFLAARGEKRGTVVLVLKASDGFHDGAPIKACRVTLPGRNTRGRSTVLLSLLSVSCVSTRAAIAGAVRQG